MRGQSWREWQGRSERLAASEAVRAARWRDERLAMLPDRWGADVGAEYERRGGCAVVTANRWLLDVTAAGDGKRWSIAATDGDLRNAAVAAAREAAGIVASTMPADAAGKARLLERLCVGHGVALPLAARPLTMPAIARLCCRRWWLRRLRKAHGMAAEGAAIAAGVVRRGLWPYASEDAVERRAAQKSRNARAIDKALLECAETGEAMPLTEVVEASLANPEVKRSELMVRIRGCDAIAHDGGLTCEFWTLTCPSRYHARRVTTGRKTEPNPNYEGATPADAQRYLRGVWSAVRAAWQRVGLDIYGLRTAEPHHDGCPHWHLIAYGTAADLRVARWILRRQALKDAGGEAGARKHRFTSLRAKAGRYGAHYAAKYVAKNIDGAGMGKARDGEAGRPVVESVRRVDAWAAAWRIRQFQFFGCPSVSGWRVLRRCDGPVGVRGSMIERARCAADDSDFAEYWRCWVRGGLRLIYRAAETLTQYGDAARARIAGVGEGGRRAMLPVKTWVISWSGKALDAAGLGFGFPRSGVNNCTRLTLVAALASGRGRASDGWADAAGALFAGGGGVRPAAIDRLDFPINVAYGAG